MNWWQTILLLVGGFAVVFAVVLPHEWWRLKQATAKFATGRTPMTDHDFLHAFGVKTHDPQLILNARRVMAQQCGVPKELIRPDDIVASLCELQFDGGDMLEMMMLLNVELNGLEREITSVYELSFRDFVVFCLERQQKTPA